MTLRAGEVPGVKPAAGRSGAGGGFVVSLLLLIWGTSCLAQEPCQPTARESQEVRAVATGIVEADNAQDLDRVMEYYAEDAVLMPPGEDPVVGKERIRPRYQQLFASFLPSIENQVAEICVSGPLAFARGRTAGTLQPKAGGEPRQLDDAYTMILQKGRDGVWRISHLMWHPRARQ